MEPKGQSAAVVLQSYRAAIDQAQSQGRILSFITKVCEDVNLRHLMSPHKYTHMLWTLSHIQFMQPFTVHTHAHGCPPPKLYYSGYWHLQDFCKRSAYIFWYHCIPVTATVITLVQTLHKTVVLDISTSDNVYPNLGKKFLRLWQMNNN